MREHISEQELRAFITAPELNDDFRRRAAEVNAHLYKCPECYDRYEKLRRTDYADIFAPAETDTEWDAETAKPTKETSGTPTVYITFSVDAFMQLQIHGAASVAQASMAVMKSDGGKADRLSEITNSVDGCVFSLQPDGVMIVRVKPELCPPGKRGFLRLDNGETVEGQRMENVFGDVRFIFKGIEQGTNKHFYIQ